MPHRRNPHMITDLESTSRKARKGSSSAGVATAVEESTRNMLACSASAGERSPAG